MINIAKILLSFVLILSDEKLNKEVEKILKEILYDANKFEFVILSAPNSIESFSIADKKEIKLIGDKCYIPIEIIEKNSKKRAIVTATLKIYKNAYKAKRDIRKGEELSKDLFEQVEIDIAGLKFQPIYSIDDIDCHRAKLNIKANEILLSNFLERKPLIKRGDQLIGVFESQYVQVSLTVFAREDGGMGDLIRVITPEKKLYKAQIINEKTVKLIGE
jgi:flagella basal body P-ring formation protein FlgA